MPRLRLALVVGCCLAVASGLLAQDLMRYVDLISPDMTEAEVTRATSST